MKPIIQIENLGKQYTLGSRQRVYGTLRESLTEAARAPFRRLSGRNDARPSGTIWALRNVNLTVQPGEALGIIGRNGSGKSTLLKVVSRITEPTEGRVALYGRVASLLEVGTGFHPELTGRENIYLNGAILGMTKSEIHDKFDEIVDFSELEKFLDTPVKRYSSGMYMRLAFAVAAHLEPEILLIDEVLAVGDAAFQQKCLGKMSKVAEEGRTVVFVSHNLTAVTQLCSRAVMLAEGIVQQQGNTADVVSTYLQSGSSAGEHVWTDSLKAPGSKNFKLHAVRVISAGSVKSEVDIDKEVNVEVEFWNNNAGARNVCTTIYLLNSVGTVVLSTGTTPAANALPEQWFASPHPAGLFRSVCTFPANFFNEGLYYLSVYITTLGPLTVEVDAPQLLSFRVFDTGAMREAGGGAWAGLLRLRLPWATEYLGAKQAAAEIEELSEQLT